jgi:MYXO-CTERM domain-containing protein
MPEAGGGAGEDGGVSAGGRSPSDGCAVGGGTGEGAAGVIPVLVVVALLGLALARRREE